MTIDPLGVLFVVIAAVVIYLLQDLWRTRS